MLRMIQNLFNSNNTVDRYLYVPFREDEMSEEYVRDVNQFKNNSESKYKNKPFIIIYSGKCNLSDLSPNSTIYVLGHGIDLSPDKNWSAALLDPKLPYEQLKHLPFSDWAYSVSGGKKAISIDQLAERMKEDGLLETDDINIKLWFCDLNHKAYAISNRFIEHISADQKNFKVDYYLNHTLSSPAIRNNKMYKWAQNNATGEVARASLIRHSLFTGPLPNLATADVQHENSHYKKWV